MGRMTIFCQTNEEIDTKFLRVKTFVTSLFHSTTTAPSEK
jgi:hypothetical protein